MKINLSQKDINRVEKLLETKSINIAFADMLMSFFDFNLSKLNINSKDEYVDIFMQALELDDSDKENVEFINTYIGDNLIKLNDSIFNSNPYFNKVRPSLKKMGEYELTLDHFYKNQSFAYDDVIIDEDFREISQIGYFDHKVSFLALSHKGEIWMNISPNEINTMQPSIDEASGDVLVYGLGLGYYPFMVALKDDVKSITIIERDEKIINIFKENLFPHFINKDKIKIIKSDAFEYQKNHKEKYDYVFVDLWHNPIDGLPMYLKFKELEQDKEKYFYWLETGIKAMYNRCLLSVVEEQLQGSTDENYKHAENEIDEVINNLYFKTKDYQINNYLDLTKLLKR